MFAHVDVAIDLDFIVQNMQKYAPLFGYKITKIWYDDRDIILHLDFNKIDIKVKFTVFPHKKTYAALKVDRAVIHGILPVSGDILKHGINFAKKYIEKSMPFAIIKVQDGIIYLENVLTHDLRISAKQLKANLFIDSNL